MKKRTVKILIIGIILYILYFYLTFNLLKELDAPHGWCPIKEEIKNE